MLRCVLALLLDTPLEELPYTRVPLHTVLEVRLCGDKVTLVLHPLNVDCVDTQRAKPVNCSVGRGLEEACTTVPLHL